MSVATKLYIERQMAAVTLFCLCNYVNKRVAINMIIIIASIAQKLPIYTAILQIVTRTRTAAKKHNGRFIETYI